MVWGRLVPGSRLGFEEREEIAWRRDRKQGGSISLSGLFGAGVFGLWYLVYAVALIGTLARYFWLRNKTLVDWLRHDAPARSFRQEAPRVENRIAEVRRAQYGNLVLYNTEDPFIGTGFVPFDLLIGKGKDDDQPVWSIAIELSRAGAPRGVLGFNARDRVDIDPVELHKVLRARLEQLNDPNLPAAQRVASITVDDHLVGEGRFHWDSPLIDRQRMIPYSQASQEAIEALIRAPQGRLRYYQRVSVSDEGQSVLAGERQIIGPVDRGIITSAFIYVAVEGHMFYLQFVPKALAPIDIRYQVIDKLPRSSSAEFLGKVLLDALRGAFQDIITAPYRVYKAIRLAFKEWRNFRDEARAETDYEYANIDIREYGSQGSMRTSLQELDTDKYTQIIGPKRMDGAITRYDDALPEPWRRSPEEFPDARPHESHDPERLERLLRGWYPNAVGATAQEIAATEERIGRPLPEELKAVYRVTRDSRSSGQPVDASGTPECACDLMFEWLTPVDEVYVRDSAYRMPSWFVAVMQAPRTPPGAAVQQLPGSPGWIVFANDYAASDFAVDLTPGATGHVGQVIALDFDEITGARLEARSLTDFVLDHKASDGTETSRDSPAVAYVNHRALTSVEAAAHPDLEALAIGVCNGEPFSLAPLIGLRKLRALTAFGGTLANPLEIASLTHLEYLALGRGEWRVVLDAGALPPNLLAANIEGSGNPLLDPPPGSAVYRELANEIAARWGRIDTPTTLIEGDLP